MYYGSEGQYTVGAEQPRGETWGLIPPKGDRKGK